MSTIYVYQRGTEFRVVSGTHQIATKHKTLAPRTYDSAGDAYKVETDARIREAILKIDPTAARSNPVTRHHVIKHGKPTYIVQATGDSPNDQGERVILFYTGANGALRWMREKANAQVFTSEELARDAIRNYRLTVEDCVVSAIPVFS